MLFLPSYSACVCTLHLSSVPVPCLTTAVCVQCLCSSTAACVLLTLYSTYVCPPAVDVGEEQPRTILSGLVHHVPIEEMKDKMVIAMCNLKPVK